jgi:hypothetical protein
VSDNEILNHGQITVYDHEIDHKMLSSITCSKLLQVTDRPGLQATYPQELEIMLCLIFFKARNQALYQDSRNSFFSFNNGRILSLILKIYRQRLILLF